MIPASRGVSLALVFGLWPTAAWATPLTADDVVRSALSRHPDTVASAAAIPAAEARRREVGSFLDNPEVAFGASLNSGLLQGSVSQPISLTGEGWYARSAAAAAVEAAQGEARRTVLRVAAEARAAYAGAVTSRERWQLADEAMQQCTQLRQAVEAREAVGEARPLDVRLARLAEAEATELAIRTRREQAQALTTLALYAPDAVGAELADDPLAVLPTTAGPSGRSDVAAVEARLRESEATLRRERAATIPRLGAGLFFETNGAPGDTLEIGPQLTVGIPLWTRNQGGIGSARAELDLARAELESLRARAGAEQAVLPEVGAYAVEALGRLGDFEQDAREALTSIELGWTTGEIGVSEAVLLRREVLDGWVAALDARQSAVEARLDVLLATEDPTLIPADPAEEDR